MPVIYHQPVDRRSFLRTAVAGAALVVLAGCRSTRSQASASSEFHVALLSDTHIPADRVSGHRGFNPWVNLERTVPEVVSSAPDAVIINGDVARLEGKPDDYREVEGLLGPLAKVAPVYLGLGNHDHRENCLAVFGRGLPGTRAPVDGKVVTVIEHPVVRVLVLDSLLETNQTPGRLGAAQQAWLSQALPGFGDRPAILVVHHTLGTAAGELQDVDAMFETVRRHPQVKAVFYGHSHVWALSERGSVQLINLPAVGYNFRDQDPVGWVDARFQRAGVTLTLRASGGNRTEDGTTRRVRWA